MRSDLVFEAMEAPLRPFSTYKTTRKLHKPNTRIQDTTNAVLVRFNGTNPIALLQRVPQPTSVPLRRAS